MSNIKEHAFSLLCRPYHIYNIQFPHTTLLLTDFYIFFYRDLLFQLNYRQNFAWRTIAQYCL